MRPLLLLLLGLGQSGCLRVLPSADARASAVFELGPGEGRAEVSPAPGTSHATLVLGTGRGLAVRRMELGGSWGTEELLPVAGLVRWTRNLISPRDPDEELAAVQSETPSDVRLTLLHRANGVWIVDQSLTLGVPRIDADTRCFDLAFEQSSGEALLVYSDETAGPVYRTYRKGSWSTPGRVFATPPGTAPVRHVLLASQPRSDQIVLLYSDSGTRLYQARWMGGGFAPAAADATVEGKPASTPRRFFSAAFEDASAEPLLVYGKQGYGCFGECSGTAVGPGLSCNPLTLACAVSWVIMEAAACRGRDEVVVVGELGSAVVWSGAEWMAGSQVLPPAFVIDLPSPWWADAACLTAAGQTVAVVVHRGWSEPEGKGKILWARSTSSDWGKWQVGAPVEAAAIGEVVSVQLEPYPANDRVMAVLATADGALWTATFDGASWTVPAAPIAGDLSTTVTRAFSFDLR